MNTPAASVPPLRGAHWLVLAGALPLLAQAAPPAASTFSNAEAKVIVEYTDTIQRPGGTGLINTTKYATDLDTGDALPSGPSAFADAAATGSGVWTYGGAVPAGTGSGGGGGTSASATAAFGTLKGKVSGAGSASGATAQGEARANASFIDYLSFSAPGGGPVSILFGLGIEGAVSANNGGASAGVSGGISIWTPTSSRLLWSNGVGIYVGASAPATSVRTTVTFQSGDTLEVAGSLGVAGGFGVSSGYEGSPLAPVSKQGSFSADASNTAEVFVQVLTPGASYTSASGTLYRTAPSWETPPIPEPQTYALMLAGLWGVALMATAKRRRGKRTP